MTKQEACALCDEIKAIIKRKGVKGAYCVIPRGGDVVALTIGGSRYEFCDRREWLGWLAAERQEIIDFAEKHGLIAKRRSPIEAMIDKACGIE